MDNHWFAERGAGSPENSFSNLLAFTNLSLLLGTWNCAQEERFMCFPRSGARNRHIGRGACLLNGAANGRSMILKRSEQRTCENDHAFMSLRRDVHNCSAGYQDFLNTNFSVKTPALFIREEHQKRIEYNFGVYLHHSPSKVVAGSLKGLITAERPDWVLSSRTGTISQCFPFPANWNRSYILSRTSFFVRVGS